MSSNLTLSAKHNLMRTFYLAVLFSLLLSTSASANVPSRENIGVGLMLGSLVAVTGKYWVSDRGAIDFGIGFSGRRGNSVYGDFLWHIPKIFGTGTKFGRETQGYLGGGAGIGYWSDSYECGRWRCDRRVDDSGTAIFIRGLFGFEWFPARTRFGVFAEVGPTMLIAPATAGSLDLGVGGRYYF